MAHVATNADVYAEARLNIFFPGVIPSLDGQCVSLEKWFLQEMSDVPDPQAARGDARYCGQTLVAQGHAVEVPFAERRRGDIICYEYGTYGHIAVQLSNGRVFEQNVNLGGVKSRVISDGQESWTVYASRIGSENEVWRQTRNPHAYRLKTYREGDNDMTRELAAAIAKWGRLLGFNSVEKMNASQEDDINHIMADPNYAAGLLESLYKGEWQVPAYLAGHYESDTKAQYNKGYADGQAASSGGNLPVGTYLKVDKANIIEVKESK